MFTLLFLAKLYIKFIVETSTPRFLVYDHVFDLFCKLSSPFRDFGVCCLVWGAVCPLRMRVSICHLIAPMAR